MSTYEEVDKIQRKDNVLITPMFATDVPNRIFERNTRSLKIKLHNSDDRRYLKAYITGIFPTYGNRTGFIQNIADGVPFFDNNPNPGPPTPINHPRSVIEVGGPGRTVDVFVPLVTSGRIYFIYDNNLDFFLTRGANGPNIVQPSVTNRTDPNYYKDWTFSEFSFNDREVYANISFVDFVSLPIAMSLKPYHQQSSHVQGFPKDGLQKLADGLIAQQKIDGVNWGKLVIINNQNASNPKTLRVLSPINAMDLFRAEGFLSNYFDKYVALCWSKYKNDQLIVDTQTREWGVVYGSLVGNELVFKKASGEQIGSFQVPKTYDVFGADQGVFRAVPGPHKELMLNIGARLDAALNRSTLHVNANQPDHDGLIGTYYKHKTCNHYANWVHVLTKDKKGYAFAYDDVKNGVLDQSGFLAHPTPECLLFNIGGGDAPQMALATQAIVKRSVAWEQDVKEMPQPRPYTQAIGRQNIDVEKGQLSQLLSEVSLPAQSNASRSQLPVLFNKLIGKFILSLQEFISAKLARFYSSPFGRFFVPISDFLIQTVVSLPSIAFRTIISRLFVLFFVLVIFLFARNSRCRDTSCRMLAC